MSTIIFELNDFLNLKKNAIISQVMLIRAVEH